MLENPMYRIAESNHYYLKKVMVFRKGLWPDT